MSRQQRFARFTRPGHAVTGDRHLTSTEMQMRVGYEWVHSLVDDHSRLAYSELHHDEKAATVTGFVERGLEIITFHDDQRHSWARSKVRDLCERTSGRLLPARGYRPWFSYRAVPEVPHARCPWLADPLAAAGIPSRRC